VHWYDDQCSLLSYGQSKAILRKDAGDELDVPRLWLAGAMVGFTVSFVESPVDLFKSQLQVQYGTGQPRYAGFFDCARKIVSSYGVRGMYQGLSATLLRDIPANAAYFGVYEMARRFLARQQGGSVRDLPAWKVLVAGGFGGMAYWIFVYPADVIKSTIQTDSIVPAERKYRGLLHTAQRIMTVDGISGFWKGFAPCIIRSFPANAVCFLAYEQALKLLGSK